MTFALPTGALTARDQYLRKTYKITEAQYESILQAQDNGCAICGREPKRVRLAVDHDHKTGEVRGLLCYHCNHRLLGKGLEDPRLHMGAAAYLLDPPARRVLSGEIEL